MFGVFSKIWMRHPGSQSEASRIGNSAAYGREEAAKLGPHRLRGVRLSVSGLRKSYHGNEVLKGIDIEVSPGEILVILGPSGGGKSVLLKHLIGLEQPDQGEVLIDGQPIEAPDLTHRYRTAMVFQSSALLDSMTVGENVGLYLTANRLKTAGEIAELVALGLEQAGLKGIQNKCQRTLGRHAQARGHRPGAGGRTALHSL